LAFPDGSTATTQLNVLDRHLESLQPWVAPRAWEATRRRFDAIRETL
jgi:hypothetical protein